MKLSDVALLCATVMVGCSGSGTGTPPSRSYITIAGPDGLTAVGLVSMLRIEGEDPHAFQVSVVSWRDRVPVVHTHTNDDGVRSVVHTLALDAAAVPGWYAIIVSPTEPDLELHVSSGVMLDDGSWALRFRTDSAPRIRMLGSNRVDANQVLVDIDFSEALDSAGADSIEVSLGGNPCVLFDNPGDVMTGVSLECAGSGSVLVVSIGEDIVAQAGGVLHARELNAAVGELYRDPI